LTSRSRSAPTLPPRACTWAGMTVGLCTGPLGPVEDARQAPMEDVGAHLQGGDAHQAPEGTGGHPAPAGGGAPAQDTGGAALPCSGGDLPLPGGETTGDKMIDFQSPPEFSFVKNMWRQFLICEQNVEMAKSGDLRTPNKPTSHHPLPIMCRSFLSYLVLDTSMPLPIPPI